MKNRKFALTLSLEENEELMNEIDSIIREHVKGIVREEAEKLIGGTVQEEAQRVVQTKLNNMKSYDLHTVMRQAIANNINWSGDVRAITADTVREWCKNNADNIERVISSVASEKLSRIVQADVLNVVVAALTAKTKE